MSLVHPSPAVKAGPAPARKSRPEPAEPGEPVITFRSLYDKIWKDGRISPGAVLTLAVILENAQQQQGIPVKFRYHCKLTNVGIGQRTGRWRRGQFVPTPASTVKRRLRELEQVEYIYRHVTGETNDRSGIYLIEKVGPSASAVPTGEKPWAKFEPGPGPNLNQDLGHGRTSPGPRVTHSLEDVGVERQEDPPEDTPAEPAGDGGSVFDSASNVNVPEAEPRIESRASVPATPKRGWRPPPYRASRGVAPVPPPEPPPPRSGSAPEVSGPPLDNVERFRQLRDRHHEKTGRWIGADPTMDGMGPIERGLAAGGDTARIWRQALGIAEPAATPDVPKVVPTQAEPAKIPVPRDRDPEIDEAIPRHLEIRKRSANWPLGSTPVWQIQNGAIQDAKAEVWQRRYRAQAEQSRMATARTTAYTRSEPEPLPAPPAVVADIEPPVAALEVAPEPTAIVEHPEPQVADAAPELGPAPAALEVATDPPSAPTSVGPEVAPELLDRFLAGKVSTDAQSRDDLIRAMLAKGGRCAEEARRLLAGAIPQKFGGTLRRVVDADRDRAVAELLERDQAKDPARRDPTLALLSGIGPGCGPQEVQRCINVICQKFDDGHSQGWHANFFRAIDDGKIPPVVALYAYARATRPTTERPGAMFVDAVKLCGHRPARPVRQSRFGASRRRGR